MPKPVRHLRWTSTIPSWRRARLLRGLSFTIAAVGMGLGAVSLYVVLVDGSVSVLWIPGTLAICAAQVLGALGRRARPPVTKERSHRRNAN